MATIPLRAVETTPPDPTVLPHNLEAEAALLGALMIDNRLAEDVQLKLRAEHFHEPLHGRIFETLAALIHAGVEEKFGYVSSAGGAFLEWLEGKELPGVAALA